MISDFSEPSGFFQYDIVTSNEVSYQHVMPELMKTPRSGGAYLGVGPEQNFTYIAALSPKIAFIFDIRRDMMLEHLMYKASSKCRRLVLSSLPSLFSRKVPAQFGRKVPLTRCFGHSRAFRRIRAVTEANLKQIIDRLKTVHHFPLSAEDERGIRAIYRTFAREGVMSFSSSFRSPGYATLMTFDRWGRQELELSRDKGELRPHPRHASAESDRSSSRRFRRSKSDPGRRAISPRAWHDRPCLLHFERRGLHPGLAAIRGQCRVAPVRRFERSHSLVHRRIDFHFIHVRFRPHAADCSSLTPVPRFMGEIFVVRHFFHPFHCLAVEPFNDRDVRHGRGWRGPMPVFFARRAP